jgi:hypothetical protein
MDNDKLSSRLEAVPMQKHTNNRRNLANRPEQGIASIYRTCDAIEGLEEGLNALRHD